MRWLVLLLLAASSVASAAGLTFGTTRPRETVLCLIPDTQNAVSLDDFDGEGGATTCHGLTGYCTGGSCTASPYCDTHWRHTSEIEVANLAYSLTGQWSLINYSTIKGSDNVAAAVPYTRDHEQCDIIISLGDMADIPNDDGYSDYVNASLATLTGLGYDYQLARVKQFWDIIQASGIPYVILQGNHDPWSWWDDLFTYLSISGKSYFYTREATYGLSYAVLVPTNTGKSFCILSIAFSDVNTDVSGQPTRVANTQSWIESTTGCGGNYPTIYASHDRTHNGFLTPSPGDGPPVLKQIGLESLPISYPGVTGMSETFMVAAGHWIDTTSYKAKITGIFGADTDRDVWLFQSNWQEWMRHNVNLGSGISGHDGAGTSYTIVTISPENKKLCAHDWAPYWQTTQTGVNGQDPNTAVYTNQCWTFDFDARYP